LGKSTIGPTEKNPSEAHDIKTTLVFEIFEVLIFALSTSLYVTLNQWFPTRVPFAIPRGAAIKSVFQYIIKNTFPKRHQILKQIAMDSPLGAANFIFSCRVPQT